MRPDTFDLAMRWGVEQRMMVRLDGGRKRRRRGRKKGEKMCGRWLNGLGRDFVQSFREEKKNTFSENCPSPQTLSQL